MRRFPRLAGVPIVTILASLAAADEPIEWKVAPRIPGQGPRYQVDRVGDGGEVRLRPGQAAMPDQLRLILGGPAEGYYLLVGQRAGATVLRVQADDVAADGTITLKTAPEAAAKLKAGDPVDLVRPAGSTTAQLRALPAVIATPAQGGDADANAEDAAEAARQVRAQVQSINNLKQIGLALHNFHSTYNCFPPAVIFGPDGKPWHSWRVLILPFLEQANLYNEYDFSQPWDSAKNRKVLEKMPAVYRDPVYNDAKGHFTHYAGLLGTNTMFSPDGPEMKDTKNPPIGEKGVGIQDVTDGTSNTILVVPVAPKAEIPWTKPDDILVLPEFPGLGKPGGIAAPYKAGAGKDAKAAAPVLFGDGSVRTIADTINRQTLSALITRNGGEIIDANAIPGGGGAGGNPNQMPILTIRIEGGKATATLE